MVSVERESGGAVCVCVPRDGGKHMVRWCVVVLVAGLTFKHSCVYLMTVVLCIMSTL